MLIYLDANIVQYCADYQDFIFGVSADYPVREPKLRAELIALRRLVELDQLADWTFAARQHLLDELHGGNPNSKQRETYRILRRAYYDSAWEREFSPAAYRLSAIEQSLAHLNLKDENDRRHLAEAIALNASWFLTNDNEIIRKSDGRVTHISVRRPSQCLYEISVGLLLK